MEFREIEEINKRVLVRIHDKINLTVLLPYLITWLPTMTYQQLERCIQNNGEAYAAATKFLDQLRCRIKLFPKMLAALRQTKQFDIYDIFIKEIKNYFQKKGYNENRFNELMKLIKDAEKEFGGEIVEDETNRTADNQSTAGAYSGPSNNDRGTGRSHSDNSNRGDNQRGDTRRDDANDNSRKQDARKNSQLGATGTGPIHVRSIDRPPSRPPDKPTLHLTERINRTVSGCRISELRSFVYNKLGKALEETNHEGQPWWEYLIENEDIEISRLEETEIEKAAKPGKHFLDLLDRRGYTLDQLQELFATNEINNALQILIDNQNKVVTQRSTLPPSDANNLNTGQEKKELPSKMNIPGSNISEQSLTSNVQIDGSQGTNLPINPTQSCTSLESTDDNTVVTDATVTDATDMSVKGTQPVQVHSDRVPDEDPVYQNVSTGNLPCLSDLQSINQSIESNRDSGDLNAVQEATRNTNVEAKPPRAEITVPITTGVHPVSACSVLGQTEDRENNDSADRQNNNDNNNNDNDNDNDDDDDDDDDDNDNDDDDDADASTETEAQVTMANRTNESSNTSAPLPTVLEDTSSSFNALNVLSLNENNTDSELTQNEQT